MRSLTRRPTSGPWRRSAGRWASRGRAANRRRSRRRSRVQALASAAEPLWASKIWPSIHVVMSSTAGPAVRGTCLSVGHSSWKLARRSTSWSQAHSSCSMFGWRLVGVGLAPGGGRLLLRSRWGPGDPTATPLEGWRSCARGRGAGSGVGGGVGLGLAGGVTGAPSWRSLAGTWRAAPWRVAGGVPLGAAGMGTVGVKVVLRRSLAEALLE